MSCVLQTFQAVGPGVFQLVDYATGQVLIVHLWGDDLRVHFGGIEEGCPFCRDREALPAGLFLPMNLTEMGDVE